MATISYFNGIKTMSVEVTEEFAQIFAETERKEALIERKETRRHQSLEASMENGFDFPDAGETPVEAAILKEEKETLYRALSKLSPSRQALIYRVYFKGEKMSDIARESGTDASAIRHKLKRAINNLKKNYAETATFGDSRGY